MIRKICVLLLVAAATLLLLGISVLTPIGDPTREESLRNKWLFLEEMLSYDQEDDRLIELIRKEYLHPPPKHQLYTTRSGILYRTGIDFDASQFGQQYWINKIFRGKANGSFVEVGAFDGIKYSNTLWIEQHLGWSGLLIEADRISFRELAHFNRNAFIIHACLNKDRHPEALTFHEIGLFGGIDVHEFIQQNGFLTKPEIVVCLPVYSIMKAANLTTVDYFSLDVNGPEYEVLSTIPWDKVRIKVFTIEYNQRKEDIWKLMKDQGYECLLNLGDADFLLYNLKHMSEEEKASIAELKQEIAHMRHIDKDTYCMM